MAKKRVPEGADNTAAPEAASDTNGNLEAPEVPQNGGGGNRPVHVLSYLVSKDTYVQASIWERTITTQNGTYVTHEVSLRKRWKDQNGEWKSLHSFRGSELYALAHAIERAEAWILEKRAENCPL